MSTGTPTSSSNDQEAGSLDAVVSDSAVRHCFEKLDRLVERLHRYPLEAVALAMGAYLQGCSVCCWRRAHALPRRFASNCAISTQAYSSRKAHRPKTSPRHHDYDMV